jgi:hypothetical protein
MKTQLAALCLAETRFVQIRLHLHEQVAFARSNDTKDYVRDRLMRCLRERFDSLPWFYLVVEDRDAAGEPGVRTHFHGAIEVPRLALPLTKKGVPRSQFLRKEATHGLEAAEYLAGRLAVDAALRQATGNAGRYPPIYNGRDQARNVWKRRPYHPLFNVEWVSYALKNMNAVSLDLPDNRLSMSRSLNTEAQRLWGLVKLGEPAIDAWP